MPNPNIVTPEQATASLEAKLPEATKNPELFLSIGRLIYDARRMAEERLQRLNWRTEQEQARS